MSIDGKFDPEWVIRTNVPEESRKHFDEVESKVLDWMECFSPEFVQRIRCQRALTRVPLQADLFDTGVKLLDLCQERL